MKTTTFGPPQDVQLRFLCPDDFDEVKSLCLQWFPIQYPDIWYQEITSSSRFFSLAATLNKTIIGLIVAEVKSIGSCGREDQGILGCGFSDDTKVTYILSIGVTEGYRRLGIASLLLDNLISHETTPDKRDVKAFYLHVLETNIAALKFYRHRGFQMFRYLPLYYAINGTHRGGYLYVLYVNGGEAPWAFSDLMNFVNNLFARCMWPCKVPFNMIRWFYSASARMLGYPQRQQSLMSIRTM